jgi:hypothetical protein
LLFNRKKESQFKVDLGDLQGEQEHLSSFLEKKLQASVVQIKGKLAVDAQKIEMAELFHTVKKFIYSRDLNRTHWASIEGETVKINRFKGHDKGKENKKKASPHQTLTQSWGI